LFNKNSKGEDPTSMKATKHLFVTILTLAALSIGAWAQTETPSNAAKPTPANATQPAITAADIQALKDALAAQQKQIQALQDRLERKDQAVQQAQTTASDAAAQAAAAQAQASQLKSDVADLKTVSNTAQDNATLKNALFTVQETQQPATDAAQEPRINKEMEGPLTIHFKGVNITPGGFAAAEFFRRSRALGADVVTPFNNITMPGASQSNLPEFFASARQSRPTIFVSSKAGSVDFSAYLSGDFLSSGTTSTATQTNGYTFRLRQVWGQAKFAHGWSVLGGQAWSLATESKAGIGPSDDTGRTNDARPATIDGAYNVGFTFARQDGIRLTKSFGDKVAIAFAVEAPQATVTTSGNTNDYVLVQAGASNTNNLTSTYGFNPSPDLIAKIAFDPGFGHYEIFGLADRFQDRVFPCEQFTSTTTGGVITYTNVSPNCPSLADAGTADAAHNSTKSGGGFGANARWNFFNKHIVFGLHGFGGSGVGRYGASQLADTAVNADGTLHLVKDLQGLATLEWHGKKLDVYSYVGSEYASRSFGYDAVQSLVSTTPVFVGYGAPTFNDSGCYTETGPGTSTIVSGPVAGSLSKCSAQTRAITEGTLGFWYRFHNGPRGRYQWGVQYSYLNRATWADEVHGVEPHGLDSMVFTSFRYYLP
jgi:hypothetical protein